VAAFPRSLREPAKPAVDAIAPTVEKAPETPTKIETPAPTPAEPAAPVVAAETTSPSEAASAHTEALLDAVVDMVQQQPSTLSVFTSGASFIGGVGAKKVVADAIASASAAASVNADKADASSVPGAPPKLDRAAAELLRPMLRQWLADNMPRIVEEALRSELTDTQGDGKDPAKS
jgi:cell pole-organizing protein PopZ